MKDWNEIYNKYNDTELMEEFTEYLTDGIYKSYDCFTESNILVTNKLFEQINIKDIWGYLICFAETKEGMVSRLMVQFAFDINIAENPLTAEEAMIRSAEVFFENAQ